MEKLPIRQRMTDRLPLVVFILCLIQPFMDVLSFWLDRTGTSNSVTLALRCCVLVFIVALGFLLTDRRRYYWAALAVLGGFTLCHVLVCSRGGYLDPVKDLTNLIRIYQLPLTTLAFITFLRRRPECLDAIRRGFFWCLAVIAAVEALSVITGTNPYTYPTKSVGVLGWFYVTSAQSAILSMLVPVAIVYVMEKKNFDPRFTLAAAAGGLGILYLFATRLTFAALLGTGAGLALSLFLVGKMQKRPTGRAAVVLLVCAALAAASIPISPVSQNMQATEYYQRLKQSGIDMMTARDAAEAEAAGLTGEELRLATLRTAYEVYLPGLVERYGLERTVRLYGYSTDAGVLADARTRKLSYCRLLLEDRPEYRLFGAELGEMSYGTQSYDLENDFYGIYVLCGGAGLALLAVFLGWFILRIVRTLLRDFKGRFTMTAAGFGLALICALAHAYFTAGVLRRPNAAFYLAAVLAAVYGLTQKNKETA